MEDTNGNLHVIDFALILYRIAYRRFNSATHTVPQLNSRELLFESSEYPTPTTWNGRCTIAACLNEICFEIILFLIKAMLGE